MSNNITPGSTLYYSILFLEDNIKSDVSVLHEFFMTIQNACRKAKEQGITKAKLNWWKTQFQKPEHPQAKNLVPIIEKYQIPEALFHEYLDGQILKLDIDHCCSLQDFEFYANREWGLPLLILSYVKNQNTQNTPLPHKACQQFALVITIATEILKQDNNLFPPLDDSQDSWLKHAEQAYDNANKLIEDNHKAIYKHLIILSYLELRQLVKIAKNNKPLTPIARLWHAWQTNKGLKNIN